MDDHGDEVGNDTDYPMETLEEDSKETQDIPKDCDGHDGEKACYPWCQTSGQPSAHYYLYRRLNFYLLA